MEDLKDGQLGVRPAPLSPRARAARRAVLLTAALSRRAHLGAGSTIGGRVGLALEPRLLGILGRSRPVVLVSGTNGKTTTTALLAAALGGPGRVATSVAGANMAAGIVSALAPDLSRPGVIEVDEGHLPDVATATNPQVIVLLNLSRDQLDRVSEVRMVAARWRAFLETTDAVVVANADDPLVAFAAARARHPRWVAAGVLWRLDARHCPVCDGPIDFATDGSWSSPCGFSRPELTAALAGRELVFATGERAELRLALPGRFNQANGALAAVAAMQCGVALDDALSAIAEVREVAGRYSRVDFADNEVRLLLAKNPAGWTELMGLLAEEGRPLVVAINARDADGHDPSWLWDVPFESLGGHNVVATGERWRDLAVRLSHAGVQHLSAARQLDAIGLAGPGRVDYIGNYTAFQELRGELASHGGLQVGPRGADAPVPRVVVDVGRRRTPSDSALRIVVVHPDLLGTYGDAGNGRVLADRALWRGLEAELVLAPSDEPLPAHGDLYCLGGGEDGPQLRSVERLRAGSLAAAVDRGAAVFAVCAGYQILGGSFPGPDGVAVEGLGLLDVETVRVRASRAVGEIVADATALELAEATLSGFENHAGRTLLGTATEPLAAVRRGIGNGDGTDGARQERVFGTYLHGPALARNPGLADALLQLVIGRPLAPLADEEEQELRAERLGRHLGARGPRLARNLASSRR